MGSRRPAGADAQAAFREAVAPIYAELEQDPAVRRQVEAITALKAATPAPPGAEPCVDCGVGPNSVWREEPDGISFVSLDPTFLPSDHILIDHWVWTRIK